MTLNCVLLDTTKCHVHTADCFRKTNLALTRIQYIHIALFQQSTYLTKLNLYYCLTQLNLDCKTVCVDSPGLI